MKNFRSRTSAAACSFLCIAALVASSVVLPARADEGMWTFDNPPLKQLKEKYNFTPTKEWLDHVRLASVRFNDGGSGSFVSPHGLVITNHHVASGQLQKLSSAQKDYLKDGFYAKSQAEELKVPDLELNVLMSMEDVTARVQGAVKPGMSEAAALAARKAEAAKIEKESTEATKLRSDVVALYQGGEYWLYRYQKYTDVRLVFAPEKQAAFFGGDPDNFTYPRYDLDVTVLRVYENGRPLDTSKHYLKWNTKGADENELVFVSGHPGSTQRALTVAQLEFQRDVRYPAILKMLKRRLAVLRDYAGRGEEQARQANDEIFGLENAQKAYTGQYEGLLDKNLMAKKQRDEAEFRALVEQNAEWKKAYGDAWDAIAKAEQRRREMYKPLRYRTMTTSFSKLYDLASTLVRYAEEVKKPDAAREDGFHDAQLESLKLVLFSPAPTYPALEERLITDALAESLEELGPDDPFVKAALGGRTPAEVAKEVTANTKVGDPAFRKSLVEGGAAAVAASNDPMIALARKLGPMEREMEKKFDAEVQGALTAAGEKLGKARFAAYGKTAYPDATFTLRLSYGTVKGYPMNGTIAPPVTTFYGLYDRAYSFGLKPPFDTPARFIERKGQLEMKTPLNFVTTNDIIGGNSGSPVINRAAEFVGIVFDGNIESLVGNFVYDERVNRTVAVHSAGIIEAMRKLYDAGALADELEGKAARAVAK
jgi:hypothetical protein